MGATKPHDIATSHNLQVFSMGQLKSYYKILCYYSHRISYPEYWCAPCILWTTRVGATTRLSKGGRDPSSPSRQPSGSCAAPRSVPGSPALPQGTARRPRGPGPPPGCVHSPSRWATSGHEETETPSISGFRPSCSHFSLCSEH